MLAGPSGRTVHSTDDATLGKQDVLLLLLLLSSVLKVYVSMNNNSYTFRNYGYPYSRQAYYIDVKNDKNIDLS